tara:strand:- start:164 stop:805 length:642 start_codon:yes stop_codon:yes gene_type:complete
MNKQKNYGHGGKTRDEQAMCLDDGLPHGDRNGGPASITAIIVTSSYYDDEEMDEGGNTEEVDTPEMKAYKDRVVSTLAGKRDSSEIDSILGKMASLTDEGPNDPQFEKVRKMTDEQISTISNLVQEAQDKEVFKQGRFEPDSIFKASFALPGERGTMTDEIVEELEDIQETTGLTLDEVIQLAKEIVMGSNKTEEEKQALAEGIEGLLNFKMR